MADLLVEAQKVCEKTVIIMKPWDFRLWRLLQNNLEKIQLIKYLFGFPLYQVFRADIIPLGHVKPTGDLIEILKRINIKYFKENVIDDKTGRIDITLRLNSEVVFDLVGLSGFSFVLGKSKKVTRMNVMLEMGLDFFKVMLRGKLKIRLSNEWLVPVKKLFGKWQIDTCQKYAEIIIDKIIIDQDWNISFDDTSDFFLGPAVIKGTETVIEGHVKPDFFTNDSTPESAALELDKSWRGVVYKTLKISSLSGFHILNSKKEIECPELSIGCCREGFHIRQGPNQRIGFAGTKI